jgi:hypothetical protein
MLQAGKMIKAEGIKWLGHVQRMDASTIAIKIKIKRIGWKPMGSPPLGRPRLRWLDDVCDDIRR